jgi:predicted nucleic acid-binding Zn ribbon protein
LRRLFGAGAAVLFKGSGFYQTDYRSESYKAAAKADQQPASGSSGTTGSNGNGSGGSGKSSGSESSKSGA